MRNIMDYWRAYKNVSYHQTMGFFTFCWKMYKGHKIVIDKELVALHSDDRSID